MSGRESMNAFPKCQRHFWLNCTSAILQLYHERENSSGYKFYKSLYVTSQKSPCCFPGEKKPNEKMKAKRQAGKFRCATTVFVSLLLLELNCTEKDYEIKCMFTFCSDNGGCQF